MQRNSSSGNLQNYTEAEVQLHDAEGDAWIIIDGYIHDVTSFLSEHPGGKDIVIPYLGRDATEIFTSESEHVHSDTAFSMLKKYRIGVVGDQAVRERARDNDRLASLVDVTKAMVPQVLKLGEDYQDWIHATTGLEKIIIFPNFLEKFTRWPWWYIYLMWTPVITYMYYLSIVENGVSVLRAAILGCFGLLVWAGFEYCLHRFVFHIKTSSPLGNLFHFFIHGIHHITPMDSTRLTFPPFFAIFLGSALNKVFLMAMSPATGVHALFAGAATGYVMYDTLHYYFHHGEVWWMPEILRKFKSLHLNHHYKDDTKNYGVTSPLFDHILGTA